MQVADVIGSILGPAFQVVAGIINGLIEVVGWLFDRLNDIINVAGEVGKAIADSPLGWLAARVGDVVGGVAGAVGNAAGAIGGAIAPQPAVAAGYMAPGTTPPPVTNVNVTLDGKEIAKSIDTRLGYGAR
jgi:hypothetical protein